MDVCLGLFCTIKKAWLLFQQSLASPSDGNEMEKFQLNGGIWRYGSCNFNRWAIPAHVAYGSSLCIVKTKLVFNKLLITNTRFPRKLFNASNLLPASMSLRTELISLLVSTKFEQLESRYIYKEKKEIHTANAFTNKCTWLEASWTCNALIFLIKRIIGTILIGLT